MILFFVRHFYTFTRLSLVLSSSTLCRRNKCKRLDYLLRFKKKSVGVVIFKQGGQAFNSILLFFSCVNIWAPPAIPTFFFCFVIFTLGKQNKKFFRRSFFLLFLYIGMWVLSKKPLLGWLCMKSTENFVDLSYSIITPFLLTSSWVLFLLPQVMRPNFIKPFRLILI